MYCTSAVPAPPWKSIMTGTKPEVTEGQYVRYVRVVSPTEIEFLSRPEDLTVGVCSLSFSIVFSLIVGLKSVWSSVEQALNDAKQKSSEMKIF